MKAEEMLEALRHGPDRRPLPGRWMCWLMLCSTIRTEAARIGGRSAVLRGALPCTLSPEVFRLRRRRRRAPQTQHPHSQLCRGTKPRRVEEKSGGQRSWKLEK